MDTGMDDATPDRIGQDRLADLVATVLEQKGLGAIAPERNLRDAGLKSMDIFNLMLSVEEEFAITIPQDQMTAENFRSITSMRRLLQRLGA